MSDVAPVSDDALDPIEQLALVYADRQARQAWEALLLLQHRLEDAARPGREPLMIQLRLSWWCDRLSEPAGRWPKGEPLLARMAVWEAEAAALIDVINGWEAKVVGEDGGTTLVEAQVAAFEALGRLVGENDPEAVRTTAEQLVNPAGRHPSLPRLTRKMRPLSVLAAHAVRSGGAGAARPLFNFGALLRIGLLGR